MYFAWTDAVQLSFVSWGVVAQFSNKLPWHRLQSNKAKLVLRDSQSPFRKSEQAVQCGKISGRLIMGCAPPAATAGTQVLIGKFSSPPFYASRWVVSRPVFQHMVVQVGCTGAGISLHCCQILTLRGALTTLPRAWSCFLFLAAHRWLPLPQRLSQGSLAHYTSQAPSCSPSPLDKQIWGNKTIWSVPRGFCAAAPCGQGGTAHPALPVSVFMPSTPKSFSRAGGDAAS